MLRFSSELNDYFLLALLKHRQNYRMGTRVPVRVQRVKAVSNVLFEKHSIPPKNLIGLGVDNCATMMGKVSAFQAQLKGACPHIFVNGCICHSLALCLSHASKKLSAWIENFICDICSYFSHSSKRK